MTASQAPGTGVSAAGTTAAGTTAAGTTGVGVIRAGIVGAGWIGQQHAETLAGRADVMVTAVCDTDPGRAAAVAGLSGAAVFADWAEMLQAAPLDALWVCTPPLAHAGPAVAALDRGLPLYLEKPIARSPADARVIVAAAARSRAVCAVGYQWHAVELIDDLRRALAGRVVGCLVGQSIGGTHSRPWFLDRAAGGGNLLERGSHHIDLARAVAGEVVAVQAAASSVRLAPRQAGEGDIDDAVTLLLHFGTGAIGSIVVAWTGDTVPGSYWLQVAAGDALLRLDLDPDYRLSGQAGGVAVNAVSRSAPFARSVGRFLDAVRAADPGLVFCPPDDAARTLAVAAAAEQALASGGTVSVATD
jgi:myo-inositol 2-dehydrogenase/D-chiro-inositol 1-dehydrogenase